MKLFVTLSSVFCALFMLSGCGSGDSSSDENTNDSVSPNNFVSGGAADAPVSMSLKIKNEISNNSFSNYYKYEGKKDETLIIWSDLEYSLTAGHRANCAAESDSPINIKIYANDLSSVIGGTCKEGVTYTLPENGTYYIHIDYGSSNFGYFHATSVQSTLNISTSDTPDSSPNLPMKLSKVGNNLISKNAFYNYFWG